MLAIALVLQGRPRGEAVAQCGMDRQTLRDCSHRYNAAGIAGLSDRPRPGPKPCLSPAQEAEVERWVEAGPDPAEHGGLVRWRRIDLRDRIERRFGASPVHCTCSPRGNPRQLPSLRPGEIGRLCSDHPPEKQGHQHG